MDLQKHTAHDFGGELQKLWNMENMLIPAMEGMIKKANNDGLRNALSFHLAETLQHKTAIEAILKQLSIAAEENLDYALQNILKQGRIAMTNCTDDMVDDLIIDNAKEIEEYEIAAYTSTAQHAKDLGYEGIAQRLWLSHAEEIQANTKLAFLKDRIIHDESVVQKSY